MTVSPEARDKTNQCIQSKAPVDSRNPDQVVHQPTQTIETLINLDGSSRYFGSLVKEFSALKFVLTTHFQFIQIFDTIVRMRQDESQRACSVYADSSCQSCLISETARPRLSYSSHLLPEEFSHPRKSAKRVTVAASLLVWLGGQAERGRQFLIGFGDIFVAAPAR